MVEVMKSCDKEKENTNPLIRKFRLTRLEDLLHVLSWSGILVLGCYNIHIMSYDAESVRLFTLHGWIEPSLFGLFNNNYNFLWNGAKNLICRHWMPFLLYLLCSKVLRSTVGSFTYMLLSLLLTIGLNYYYSSFCFLCLEMSIVLLVSLVATSRQKGLVWIVGLTMLHCLTYVNKFSFYSEEYMFANAYSYLALLITRAISIGLCISSSTKYETTMFLELLFYYFYFPAIIGCRMMSIRQFVSNIHDPYRGIVWKKWLLSGSKLLIYFFVWHVISMLVPVHLVLFMSDPKDLDILTLTAMQLFNGLNFYMAYYVLYKTVFLVTMLDGFLTTDGPECVVHIALYSRLWRTFDRGLYVWLQENIYKPVIESSRLYRSRHVGALASFGFVAVFHGLTVNNILWVVINVIQIYCEKCVTHIVLCTKFGAIARRRLSPTCNRRILGVLVSVSFLTSLFAFGAFSFGLEATTEMYGAIFNSDSNYFYHRTLVFCLFLYAQSQFSLTAY